MKHRKKEGARPSEDELKAALRDLSAEVPDPAFRERLRREFTGGELAESAEASRHGAPARPERRIRGERESGRPGRWHLPWPGRAGWILAPAGLAAAVVLGFLLNRGPAWTLVEVAGAGPVTIDGHAVPATDPAELARRLRPRASIVTPEDVTLVLRSRGVMMWELAPGTRVTLPPPPGRWVGRNIEGRVESGDLRVLTGSRFPGRRLRLRTEEGITQLTGTAVSVYRDEYLTCVCVLEGVAEVGADEQDLEPIPAGMLKAMPVGGGDPVVHEILSEHANPLAEFVEKYRGAVDAGSRHRTAEHR